MFHTLLEVIYSLSRDSDTIILHSFDLEDMGIPQKQQLEALDYLTERLGVITYDAELLHETEKTISPELLSNVETGSMNNLEFNIYKESLLNNLVYTVNVTDSFDLQYDQYYDAKYPEKIESIGKYDAVLKLDRARAWLKITYGGTTYVVHEFKGKESNAYRALETLFNQATNSPIKLEDLNLHKNTSPRVKDLVSTFGFNNAAFRNIFITFDTKDETITLDRSRGLTPKERECMEVSVKILSRDNEA